MEMTVIVLVVLLIAGAVVFWALRRGGGASAPAPARREEQRLDTVIGWPPQATRILTTAERQAYQLLSRELDEYMILAQVPIARFTRVPTRNSYAEWLRRIGTHCADLVVCDKASHVIAVVHIEPAAGEDSDRARRRVARMKKVLKAEGIVLHVWREGVYPAPETLREKLLPAGKAAASAPVAPAPVAPAPAVVAPTVPASGPDTPASPFEDSRRDSTFDERIEMRDAPPSTWYDDLDTGMAPLDPAVKRPPPR